MSGAVERRGRLGTVALIAASDPSRLAAFLSANNIPRPNGASRCPAPQPSAPAAKKRKCKKKGKRRSAERAKKKRHKCKKRHKKH
jgi:hypothetical protein